MVRKMNGAVIAFSFAFLHVEVRVVVDTGPTMDEAGALEALSSALRLPCVCVGISSLRKYFPSLERPRMEAKCSHIFHAS